MNDLKIGSLIGDELIERLNKAGYDAYYVGGCVRNAILGIESKDFDIASSATPQEVKALFNNYTVIETGLKHGTITIVFDVPYEITTFRKEGKYSDSRHPDKVYFCNSIIDDLSRRDFTCNAMAFSKNKGIIDVFGGFYDTHNHILRAVGAPTKRFKEDALRILRGLRFASEFGFLIEDSTARAMKSNKQLIRNVSRERMYSEIKKIFNGKYFNNAVKDYFEIINETLSNRIFSEKYAEAIEASYRCAGDFYVKFAVFLYVGCNKNINQIKEILNFLRPDNKLKKTLNQCISCMDILSDDLNIFSAEGPFNKNRKYIIKKILNKCSGAHENFVMFLQSLSIPIFSFEIFENTLNDILSKNECYLIRQLDITGIDVVAEGYYGCGISDTLNKVLDSVMREQIPNEKKHLLDFIRTLRKQTIN